MKEYILTLGKGKNKRQWCLTEEDFRTFQLYFEERELIDLNSEEWSWLKEGYPVLTKVDGGAIDICGNDNSIDSLLLLIGKERNGYGKDTYKLASKAEI